MASHFIAGNGSPLWCVPVETTALSLEMAAFGLTLNSPLVPNVDAYINPSKDDDTHRSGLNAVVSLGTVNIAAMMGSSLNQHQQSQLAIHHVHPSTPPFMCIQDGSMIILCMVRKNCHLVP